VHQLDSLALSPRENRSAAYDMAAAPSRRNTPELTQSGIQAKKSIIIPIIIYKSGCTTKIK